MDPYWPSLGTAASVDWCEPNYVWTAYIAEFWNTLSSAPIAGAGFFGVCLVVLANPPKEMRFGVAFAVLAVIGLGSMAFHGTLLKLAQAADELPMVYGGLTFAYILRWRRSEPVPSSETAAKMRRWQAGLTAYAVAFTVGYFTFEAYFLLFIFSYAGIVAMIVAYSGYLTFRVHDDAKMRRLFWLSSGSYVAGVGGLWIPEHVLLPCDHPIQALQLHAWFHLTSAIGSYFWVRWAMYERELFLAQGTPRAGS